MTTAASDKAGTMFGGKKHTGSTKGRLLPKGVLRVMMDVAKGKEPKAPSKQYDAMKAWFEKDATEFMRELAKLETEFRKTVKVAMASQPPPTVVVAKPSSPVAPTPTVRDETSVKVMDLIQKLMAEMREAEE